MKLRKMTGNIHSEVAEKRIEESLKKGITQKECSKIYQGSGGVVRSCRLKNPCNHPRDRRLNRVEPFIKGEKKGQTEREAFDLEGEGKGQSHGTSWEQKIRPRDD